MRAAVRLRDHHAHNSHHSNGERAASPPGSGVLSVFDFTDTDTATPPYRASRAVATATQHHPKGHHDHAYH